MFFHFLDSHLRRSGLWSRSATASGGIAGATKIPILRTQNPQPGTSPVKEIEDSAVPWKQWHSWQRGNESGADPSRMLLAHGVIGPLCDSGESHWWALVRLSWKFPGGFVMHTCFACLAVAPGRAHCLLDAGMAGAFQAKKSSGTFQQPFHLIACKSHSDHSCHIKCPWCMLNVYWFLAYLFFCMQLVFQVVWSLKGCSNRHGPTWHGTRQRGKPAWWSASGKQWGIWDLLSEARGGCRGDTLMRLFNAYWCAVEAVLT